MSTDRKPKSARSPKISSSLMAEMVTESKKRRMSSLPVKSSREAVIPGLWDGKVFLAAGFGALEMACELS